MSLPREFYALLDQVHAVTKARKSRDWPLLKRELAKLEDERVRAVKVLIPAQAKP